MLGRIKGKAAKEIKLASEADVDRCAIDVAITVSRELRVSRVIHLELMKTLEPGKSCLMP